jgi:hypothetical protein
LLASLLDLLTVFEKLLLRYDPKLYNHLSFKREFHPLTIVFPWINTCFIGYIEVTEQFKVFDAIMQTKSLLILPLLAYAILTKFRDPLLKAYNNKEIKKEIDPYKIKSIDVFELLEKMSGAVFQDSSSESEESESGELEKVGVGSKSSDEPYLEDSDSNSFENETINGGLDGGLT